MTVKQLISQLLNMPMDGNVSIIYSNDKYDYEYQNLGFVVQYSDVNGSDIGLVGTRDDK